MALAACLKCGEEVTEPRIINREDVDMNEDTETEERQAASEPCCKYNQKGLNLLNGFIITASARAGKSLYDGKPFEYCPWCGVTINLT